MTLSGPQKIPFASTTYWYGDRYPGSAMESNVVVLHTTEGATLPSYDGGAVAPNVTGVPDFPSQTLKWYQHFDVDRSSRALVNLSGGVETNTLNSFQVELVGTCDPSTHQRWENAGVQHIYWPEAPDWALAGVAKLLKWLNANHGVQLRSTVTFKAYPGSYGASNGVRLTGAQWQAYYGILGHQHVPENLHGDPGAIDINRILALAGGAEVEEDVAAEDVWKADVINASPPPYNNTDYPDNKTWTAGYALSTAVLTGRKTEAKVEALAEQVEALAAKVDALSVGGVDLDALAAKVAAELSKRLQA